MSSPPHPPWFNHPNNIRRRIKVMKLIIIGGIIPVIFWNSALWNLWKT
jgi:hypothetical protein